MIDFNRMVDNHLKTEMRPRAVGRYYPSEAGSCLRKVYLSFKNPKETKADLTKIFAMGNLVHDFVVDVLKSEKNPDVQLLDTEVPFKHEIDGLVVSGRVDDMIMIKDTGKTILVEVKSTKLIKLVKEPQEAHELQLQLYMHFMGIMNGMIIYVEKNTLQSKSFTLQYDKSKAEYAISRFKTLHRHLLSGTMPEPECRGNGKEWMCGYCDYRDECGKN